MADVEFFFDPVCPWAWIMSRWAVKVEDQRGLHIDGTFICLRMVNGDKDDDRDVSPGPASWTWPARDRGPTMTRHGCSTPMPRSSPPGSGPDPTTPASTEPPARSAHGEQNPTAGCASKAPARPPGAPHGCSSPSAPATSSTTRSASYSAAANQHGRTGPHRRSSLRVATRGSGRERIIAVPGPASWQRAVHVGAGPASTAERPPSTSWAIPALGRPHPRSAARGRPATPATSPRHWTERPCCSADRGAFLQVAGRAGRSSRNGRAWD